MSKEKNEKNISGILRQYFEVQNELDIKMNLTSKFHQNEIYLGNLLAYEYKYSVSIILD